MIKPLNENVLLKKEIVENKTASGIIVSTSEKSEENVGVVVAVGQGKLVDGKREPMTVKVNDRVIFEKYSANEIEYKNEKYLIVNNLSKTRCTAEVEIPTDVILKTNKTGTVKLINILNNQEFKLKASLKDKKTRLLMYPYSFVWLKLP